MKAFMYHGIRQIIALIASLLFLTACADYSYEEQILTRDDVQSEYETQIAASFDGIETIKTLYVAAGKGEDEFNRVLEALPTLHAGTDGARKHTYSYERSTGKYRDEFLTAYNNYKDVLALGHQDGGSIESILLYQNGDTRSVQYQFDIADEAGLQFLICFNTMNHITSEIAESTRYDYYEGDTFNARIFLERQTSADFSDHTHASVTRYRVEIFDLDDTYMTDFTLSVASNHTEKEALFRWLDQFYLSTFGEVVQNAEAFDMK